MAEFTLTELISTDTLQRVQDAFSEFAGMAALITDANGVPVTVGSGFTRFCMELTRKSETGCKYCEACDRDGAIMTLKTGKPYVYSCHAGLTDYAAPIMAGGEFVGSFIGGQVRTAPVDEEHMRKCAEKYGIDADEYIAAASDTNELPQESIEKAAKFLSELAGIMSSIALEKRAALELGRRSEQTARNRNDFLTQLSQDLHSTVGSMMQLLSETGAMSGDPKLKAEVDELLARTGELERMTDGTVEYMNIMDEEFTLRETVYDIRSVAELGLIHHEEEAKKKNTKVEISVDESVPAQLYGDPARIERILSRMVQYAIQYTDGGAVDVGIYCRKQSYASMLMIVVSDNGVGMKPEELERARQHLAAEDFAMNNYHDFPMFEFSLMGHMVRIMSGKVQVESVPGEGSTFTLEIPQLAASA